MHSSFGKHCSFPTIVLILAFASHHSPLSQQQSVSHTQIAYW